MAGTHFSWDENALERLESGVAKPLTNTIKTQVGGQMKQMKSNTWSQIKSIFEKKPEPKIGPDGNPIPDAPQKEVVKNSNFTPLTEDRRKALAQQWDLKSGTDAEIDQIRARLHQQVVQESRLARNILDQKERERLQKIEQEKAERAQKLQEEARSANVADSGQGKAKARLGQARKKASTQYQDTHDTAENKMGRQG